MLVTDQKDEAQNKDYTTYLHNPEVPQWPNEKEEAVEGCDLFVDRGTSY
jgi:peptide deformylase